MASYGLDRKFVDLWRHTKTVCVPLLAVVHAHYSEEVPTTANSANRSRARRCPASWHTSTDAGPATTPGSGTQEGLSRST